MACFCHRSNAQNDSTDVEYSTESMKESDYQSGKKYKYLDRNMIEEKYLLKAGLNSVTEDEGAFGLFIEYERKLGLSHSISAGLHYDFFNTSDLHHDLLNRSDLNLTYKYFYSSKKKINNNEKANNLNGPFVGFKGVIRNFGNKEHFNGDELNQYKMFWGIQNRLGRWGYLEFNAGINYTPNRLYSNYYSETNEWITRHNRFNTYFGTKLAFAIGNPSKNSQNPAPFSTKVRNSINNITRQMDRDVIMFKVGFNQFDVSEEYYNIKGLFGIEQKILPTLSVLGEVKYSTYKNNDSQFSISSYSFNIGTRYYYSLAKRMNNGVSVNNFSANYISLEVKDISTHNGYNSDHKLQLSEHQNPSLNLLWGMQRKIGKFNYLDFNTGLKFVDKYKSNYGIMPTANLTFGFGW